MKKLALLILTNFLLISLSCFADHLIKPGFYLGAGSGWSSFDESFHSDIFRISNIGATDTYDANRNRIVPMAQLGYWSPFCSNWLWGVTGQWKYLGYNTPNVNSSAGQHIPNATFSSINLFGPEVLRDFSSKTNVNHEFMTLFYLGTQINNGYAYFGVGPALLTAKNNIYVTSIHTGATGDYLIASSVSNSKTIWAGAAQIGYNYYLDPTWFLNFNYTFLQSDSVSFNNSANAAILNGAVVAGPNEINFDRGIKVREQGLMLSINKIIC